MCYIILESSQNLGAKTNFPIVRDLFGPLLPEVGGNAPLEYTPPPTRH